MSSAEEETIDSGDQLFSLDHSRPEKAGAAGGHRRLSAERTTAVRQSRMVMVR